MTHWIFLLLYLTLFQWYFQRPFPNFQYLKLCEFGLQKDEHSWDTCDRNTRLMFHLSPMVPVEDQHNYIPSLCPSVRPSVCSLDFRLPPVTIKWCKIMSSFFRVMKGWCTQNIFMKSPDDQAAFILMTFLLPLYLESGLRSFVYILKRGCAYWRTDACKIFFILKNQACQYLI